MDVSVKTLGKLGYRLTIVVPPERIENDFTMRIKKLAQSVKMPGFRQGKVPEKMVEAQHGERVRAESLSDLINDSFREVVEEKGLRPVGAPKIEPKPLTPKGLTYTAEFEVLPTLEKLKTEALAVEQPQTEITAEDIDTTLETLRKQNSDWQNVTRAAQEQDQLIIDYQAFIDDQAQEKLSSKDFRLVLGTKSILEEIDAGLIGAEAGQTRDIDVPFPAEHNDKNIAGKTIKFKITVQSVAEPILPEVNEAFAEKLGIKEGGIETLKEEIKKKLEQQASEAQRAATRQRVMQALLDANSFDIPTTLVEQEIERLKEIRHQRMHEHHHQHDCDAPIPPDELKKYEQIAQKRTRISLMFAQIANDADIKAEAGLVRSKINTIAQLYKDPDKVVGWYYSNPDQLSAIESEIVEEHVVDHILAKANVKTKPMTFQELLALSHN